MSPAESTLSLWDPASGRFDGCALRAAVVARGWTVREFARTACLSRACMYRAIGGRPMSDRAAIRVFETLIKRAPILVVRCQHAVARYSGDEATSLA